MRCRKFCFLEEQSSHTCFFALEGSRLIHDGARACIEFLALSQLACNTGADMDRVLAQRRRLECVSRHGTALDRPGLAFSSGE